jgi:hypothetical protein
MPRVEALAPAARPEPPRPRGGTEPAELADARFRALVGEARWAQLPAPVQRRFSKRLAPGETIVYRGAVVSTELSRAGRALAFLARAIGAPLPVTNGATGAAVVVVSEDDALGGQSWTRMYARPGRFPQVVHSAKRFRGATGLEEYVGYGVGMALKVTVEERALVFRSEHFFVGLGKWRWRLPRLLEPGVMRIIHREEGGGRFAFALELTHPVLGRLISQLAYFADP